MKPINAPHNIAVPSWKKEKTNQDNLDPGKWKLILSKLPQTIRSRCHNCGSSRAQNKNYISNFREWHSSLNSARHTFHEWCFNAESIGIFLNTSIGCHFHHWSSKYAMEQQRQKVQDFSKEKVLHELWLNGSCRFISLGTIVAAETEAGFCPKSEHIIFQHWVPTFGKPILKFLGFGFAQLLLSLRLDNKCVLSILRWKTNNFRQFLLKHIIWVIFPVFPWKTHTFCTFSTLTDPKTFTMAFLCQTSAYSASGAQTCSELVRDLFGFRSGFVLFLFFGWFLQPNLVGTCSELVRVSFGSGAGSMWDCFFSYPAPK